MFYDRFKELCDKRGISCNRAALEMGLSNATPTAWKKRGLTPKADTLAVIANYFGVTTDYLLGEEAEKQPTVSDGLHLDHVSEEDMKTIKAILAMPEEQRKALAKLLGISE